MTRAPVLVAHASKNGSTAEIAEAIAEELRSCGHEVDCIAAGDVHDISRYGTVIVGSAVYMKRWRREAKRLLRHHAKELVERDLWIFSSGPVGEEADFDSEWCRPPKVTALANELGAHDHAVFGGRVPIGGTGPMEKAMVRDTPAEFADLRDWEVIRLWARAIAATVAQRESAAVG